jgi:hypothetical protein
MKYKHKKEDFSMAFAVAQLRSELPNQTEAEFVVRAGHSLIYSRFAIRSPLNFFPGIADAHAFIFWISSFAPRSIAPRSTSGSLSDKMLITHRSLW